MAKIKTKVEEKKVAKKVVKKTFTEIQPKKTISTKLILTVVVAILVIVGTLYLLRGMLIVAFVDYRPIWRWEVVRTLEKQNGKEAFDSLLTEKLIQIQARNNNVVATPDAIKQEIENLEKAIKDQGSDLDTVLQLQGQTREDVENNIKLKIVVESLLKDKLNVTDDEILQYYNSNKVQYAKQTLSEVKESIKNTLYGQKLNQEYQKWLEEIKANAKVMYLHSY